MSNCALRGNCTLFFYQDDKHQGWCGGETRPDWALFAHEADLSALAVIVNLHRFGLAPEPLGAKPEVLSRRRTAP